ncbi:DUF6758 family protein [Nocardioides aestuarii]|uniref:DUF6758 family protein n=1 Tax=Nocardioides aestuarii TaxID=252231 RepID=A0ABW4TT60_9ACTN
MTLQAGCPRCRERFAADGPRECPAHGEQPPLWRPEVTSYDAFTAHLERAAGFPTYLPWPMGSGWRVSDFGVVAGDDGPAATVTCVSGTTGPDGRVDVLVVVEEPGIGLGGRCAGLEGTDPGPDFGHGPPTVRVRVGSQGVALWPVSTAGADVDLDRSVVAGEVTGRWLWLVLHPASAVLLLADEWWLRDVADDGPHLVEMPCEGPGPVW